MNISPISCQSRNNCSPAFNANLWVDKSVNGVIYKNKETFLKAADSFEHWLQNEKGGVFKTLNIRKNTSLVPKVAIERRESKLSYAYPHEETGYNVTEWVKKYEDLEFELGDRKCGFWFDPAASAEKLVSDFKNMFNYLHKS